MVKSAVRKLILEHASATSLLGSGGVFPSRLPSKYALPSIVIVTIASMPQTMHGGNSGRVMITDLQLTILASNEAQLDLVQEMVIESLDLQNETVTLGSDTVSILASFLEDIQDLQGYEYEKEDELVRSLDFSFIWR